MAHEKNWRNAKEKEKKEEKTNFSSIVHLEYGKQWRNITGNWQNRAKIQAQQWFAIAIQE